MPLANGPLSAALGGCSRRLFSAVALGGWLWPRLWRLATGGVQLATHARPWRLASVSSILIQTLTSLGAHAAFHSASHLLAVYCDMKYNLSVRLELAISR